MEKSETEWVVWVPQTVRGTWIYTVSAATHDDAISKARGGEFSEAEWQELGSAGEPAWALATAREDDCTAT